MFDSSLGESAVFLIAENGDTTPIPIYLESGDVLILSGPVRGYLHGVPKSKEMIMLVLPTPSTHPIPFMQHTRININTRQVMT